MAKSRRIVPASKFSSLEKKFSNAEEARAFESRIIKRKLDSGYERKPRRKNL